MRAHSFRLTGRCKLLRAVCFALLIGVAMPSAWCAVKKPKVQKPAKENRRADAKIIEGMEEQWRVALLHADSDSLEKLLDEDFTGISANGVLSDKQQYLRRIRTRTHRFSTIDQLTLKTRIKSPIATVTSEARVDGELDGQKIGGVFRYTRVYQRNEAGDWKIVNFEATRVSRAIAGENYLQGGVPLRAGGK